jgi:hypothetical protein
MSLILREGYTFGVFEDGILRKIFGHKRGSNTRMEKNA